MVTVLLLNVRIHLDHPLSLAQIRGLRRLVPYLRTRRAVDIREILARQRWWIATGVNDIRKALRELGFRFETFEHGEYGATFLRSVLTSDLEAEDAGFDVVFEPSFTPQSIVWASAERIELVASPVGLHTQFFTDSQHASHQEFQVLRETITYREPALQLLAHATPDRGRDFGLDGTTVTLRSRRTSEVRTTEMWCPSRASHTEAYSVIARVLTLLEDELRDERLRRCVQRLRSTLG